MATCTNNPRLGIQGCGATYGGELQHSVAKVAWSAHPDGRAHVTASRSLIDECWAKGRDSMADPSLCGFHQSTDGRWRWPDSGRNAGERRGLVPQSDANADQVPRHLPNVLEPLPGVVE